MVLNEIDLIIISVNSPKLNGKKRFYTKTEVKP